MKEELSILFTIPTEFRMSQKRRILIGMSCVVVLWLLHSISSFAGPQVDRRARHAAAYADHAPPDYVSAVQLERLSAQMELLIRKVDSNVVKDVQRSKDATVSQPSAEIQELRAKDLEKLEQATLRDEITQLAIALRAMQRSLKGQIFDRNANLTRALFAQFGLDAIEMFLPQLKWLIVSWIHMRKLEPANLRTDIVIFCEVDKIEKLSPLISMGCSTVLRTSESEPSMCRLHQYTPLFARDKAKDPVARDIGNYHYGESTQPVAEYPDTSWEYDLLLRSDLDAFFTIKWATWFPSRRDAMYVGDGGYIHDSGERYQTLPRLQFVAKRLGLKLPELHNVGTSWLGSGRLMVAAAKLQSAVIRWLELYEFTAFDAQGEAGITGWPNWHHAVLTLYGGEVAFNQFDRGGLQKLTNELSEGSCNAVVQSGAPSWIDSLQITHAHVLHGDDKFSKFAFVEGQYDSLDLSTLNPLKLGDYCTMVAVQSLRMSNAQVKMYMQQPKLFENGGDVFLALEQTDGVVRRSEVHDKTRLGRSSDCWSQFWARWVEPDGEYIGRSDKVREGEGAECAVLMDRSAEGRAAAAARYNYTMLDGDCAGNDMNVFTGVSEDRCREECSLSQGCAGVSYNANNQRCVTKFLSCKDPNPNSQDRFFLRRLV